MFSFTGMMILQFLIAVTGVFALWCTTTERPGWRVAAPVSGLTSQVFWVCSLWGTDQYGLMVICFAYTSIWIYDAYSLYTSVKENAVHDQIIAERQFEANRILSEYRAVNGEPPLHFMLGLNLFVDGSIGGDEFLRMLNDPNYATAYMLDRVASDSV